MNSVCKHQRYECDLEKNRVPGRFTVICILIIIVSIDFDLFADKVDVQVRNIEYGGKDTAVGQLDVVMFKDKQILLSFK